MSAQSLCPLTSNSIDGFALSIINTLQAAQFEAYVVGGGVRDRLVGLTPKDFDIATNAKPEEVKALFKNCRLIGHRFRLAHIYHRQHIIEVATFRAAHDGTEDREDAHTSHHGMIVRDNVYGTLQEDVARRDFTINALYYDPTTNQIHDFVQGLEDLRQQRVRLIGDPVLRLREDPVRILRAIRIANKLGFYIDSKTAAAFPTVAANLQHVPPGRLFDEYIKLFLQGHGYRNFVSLQEHHIFALLFPRTAAQLSNPVTRKLVEQAIRNTDQRIQAAKGVNPAFLLAAFLWPTLRTEEDQRTAVQEQRPIAIPKRFSQAIREIWQLQPALEERHPKHILSILDHIRFRAAYDFMLLRVDSGELPEEVAEWWTQIQSADDVLQREMIAQLPVPHSKRRRRRRRKKS